MPSQCRAVGVASRGRVARAACAALMLGVVGSASAHPLGMYIYRDASDDLVMIFPWELYWPVKYRIPPYLGYLDADYPFEEAIWDRPHVGLYQTHLGAKIEFVVVQCDPGVKVRDPLDIENAVSQPGERFVIGTTQGLGFLVFPWWHLDEGDPAFIPGQESYSVSFYLHDIMSLHGDSPVYTFNMYPSLESCPADLTGSALPSSPSYGIPDGVLSGDDFFYYLIRYTEGYTPVADLTSTATPGTPGYGIPDGIINTDDFFYYLSLYAIGC